MDKKYIKEYNNLETTNWWFITRKKIISQLLQKFIPRGKAGQLKILNVGIASGESSRWLSEFGDVVSVENDPDFLEYLHSQNFDVTAASITALPFQNNTFDLVCAFDVIEHVEQDKLAIQELWRVCKFGGSLCLTVPAFQELWGSHDIVNNHKRRYTKRRLHELLDENENEIVYSAYFNFILFIPIFIFRKMTSIFKPAKKNHSDFAYFSQDGFTNKLLKKVFGIEPYLMRWIKFPFGVSIFLLAQKKSAF